MAGWVGPFVGQRVTKAVLIVLQPEIDRVVELQCETLLTMLTTSGAGTDSDNATLAGC